MIEKTKYGFSFPQEAVVKNINRLTNQLWKLIPMRENGENWQGHLESLIVELSGLAEVFLLNQAIISLLSKLEGLVKQDTEFMLYRKIVFEAISLLRDSIK